MKHFSFVSEDNLRLNLENAFKHVEFLVFTLESPNINQAQLSSIRKTVIIHIAALIEALLLWKLKQVNPKGTMELDGQWKYADIKIVYQINSSKQVVAGIRKREQKKLDKLDFLQISRACLKNGIIKSEQLFRDVDDIRKFRNRQHLGGLKGLERDYSKDDLEFCFSVVSRVIKAVSG